MTSTTILEVARLRELLSGPEPRRIRERAHLSRTDMADALGVSPQAIEQWEAHRCLPRTEVAVRYAALLRELEQVPTSDREAMAAVS